MEKTVFSAQLVEGLAALDKCCRNEQNAATTLSKKKTPKAAHNSGPAGGMCMSLVIMKNEDEGTTNYDCHQSTNAILALRLTSSYCSYFVTN